MEARDLHRRGATLKVIRRNEQPHTLVKTKPGFPRDLFFFYEKTTGVAHFHVEATPDGRFPVDQAAGLLAMHCMVRGQAPSDYVVMVRADEDQLEGLREKAEHLLAAGKSVNDQVKLTRREEEVLGGVMRSLANKEIASQLNLSERTVKFHVSSLLAKFRVRGRMELVREATRHTPGPLSALGLAATREAHEFIPSASPFSAIGRTASVVVPLAPKRPMTA
jgi:DNA-binding CsgD family transcriptional regulator